MHRHNSIAVTKPKVFLAQPGIITSKHCLLKIYLLYLHISYAYASYKLPVPGRGEAPNHSDLSGCEHIKREKTIGLITTSALLIVEFSASVVIRPTVFSHMMS